MATRSQSEKSIKTVLKNVLPTMVMVLTLNGVNLFQDGWLRFACGLAIAAAAGAFTRILIDNWISKRVAKESPTR